MIKIEKQISSLDKQIKTLEDERNKKRRSVFWPCPNCGKKTRINKLGILTEQFYVSPSGCTDGDYWLEGDKPIHYIICPKCDKEVRLYQEDTEAYRIAKEYRYYFGRRGTRYDGCYYGDSQRDEWNDEKK